MRLLLAVLVLVALSGQCAKPHPPVPQPIQRYVFVESLPPETQVCVRQNPWLDSLSCIDMWELRQIIRGLRRASAD
jgi:hypothetical protein